MLILWSLAHLHLPILASSRNICFGSPSHGLIRARRAAAPAPASKITSQDPTDLLLSRIGAAHTQTDGTSVPTSYTVHCWNSGPVRQFSAALASTVNLTTFLFLRKEKTK
jgi:hypothetical protein